MARRKNVHEVSRLFPRTARRSVVRLALLLALSLGSAAIHCAEAQTGTLQGAISTSGADGRSENLPGASVKWAPATPGRTPTSTVTNYLGEYKITNLAPGPYILQVDLAGFRQHTGIGIVMAGVTTIEDIRLELQDVQGQVTVAADGDSLNTTEAAPSAAIGQDRLQTVPLVNERFQDALPLVPGVVRGPDGLINVKGARASQSGLTVNSANVTDPVTGEFAINLPIEAIESVAVG